MKELSNWSELFFQSFRAFGEKLMKAIPTLIGAIFILLIGWLVAKVISNIIARVLKVAKFDVLSDKVKASEFLEKANIEMTPSKFISRIVYWVIMLVVITSAANAMGWYAVSEQISAIIGYLPNLLVAITFFIVGTYIASFVRDVIKGATGSLGISTGKLISNVVFYFMLVVVTLTALDQGGIDTSIITTNLILILGAILLAGAISYGFASKDVLANILASFFSRRTYAIGQTIEVNGVQGKLIDMSTVAITLLDEHGNKIIIPSHTLMTNQVKILK